MKNLLAYLRDRPRQVILVGIVIVLSVIGIAYYSGNEVMPQSAILFLNDVSIPQAGQKVLVFSPHPDDETLGAGGYIAASEQRGATVYIVLVTDGNKHHLKNQRYLEFQNATAVLGVSPKNLVYLNYPDGTLQKQDKNILTTQFEQQIKKINPDFLLYPYPQDMHPDHAVTGQIAQEIEDSQMFHPMVDYQYLVHHNVFPQPKKYRPDLYLLPPVKLVSFDKEWQRFMLSPEIEQKKDNAVNTYKTQLKMPFLRSLLLSLVRRNELFVTDGGQNP